MTTPTHTRFTYSRRNSDGSVADGLEIVFAKPVTVEHATHYLAARAADGNSTLTSVEPATPSTLRTTPFRTPTGQTGTDAYIYEAAQIQNALRDLNKRAHDLAEAMATELPADASGRWGIASESYPDAYTAFDRESLARVLREHVVGASDAVLLERIARGLADPEYVIDARVEGGTR